MIAGEGATSDTPPATEPAVPPTEAPTTPPTEAPTVPPTEAPTTPPTEAPTVPPTEAPEEEPGILGSWNGIINVSTSLRIRSGPGTGYEVTGYLYKDDAVTVTERKTIDGLEWGRVEKGWISLKYVTFVEEPAPTEPAPTEPEPTEPPQTEPAPTEPPVTEPPQTEPAPTEPAPTEPPQTEPQQPTVPDGPGYWIGTVTAKSLQIREGAGAYNSIIGYLTEGDYVEITECFTVGGQTWGYAEKGWICLDHVQLDGESTAAREYLTVNTCSLRVRDGAGITNAIVSFLPLGQRLEILEQRSQGASVWGLTAWGWVDLRYLR